jgi:hypothetical protein
MSFSTCNKRDMQFARNPLSWVMRIQWRGSWFKLAAFYITRPMQPLGIKDRPVALSPLRFAPSKHPLYHCCDFFLRISSSFNVFKRSTIGKWTPWMVWHLSTALISSRTTGVIREDNFLRSICVLRIYRKTYYHALHGYDRMTIAW